MDRDDNLLIFSTVTDWNITEFDQEKALMTIHANFSTPFNVSQELEQEII